MPSTPLPTHKSALRLFFTLMAAVLRLLGEVRHTRKLFAKMAAAVAREAAAREHVDALQRTLVTAKDTLQVAKKEATVAVAEAVAADADIKDRVTVFIGGPQ